jgi:hypothetical protein
MPKKSYTGEIIRDGTEEPYYVESLAALYTLIKKLGDYDEMTILCKEQED